MLSTSPVTGLRLGRTSKGVVTPCKPVGGSTATDKKPRAKALALSKVESGDFLKRLEDAERRDTERALSARCTSRSTPRPSPLPATPRAPKRSAKATPLGQGQRIVQLVTPFSGFGGALGGR